ncbi:hypothetical protein BKA93DRAFT_213113 [Sparassis latifolia]
MSAYRPTMPGILKVHRFGPDYDGFAPVMELIAPTVEILRNPIVPPSTVGSAVVRTSTVSCLEGLHSKGLVHCDIKTQNIGIGRATCAEVVTFDEGVYLDFLPEYRVCMRVPKGHRCPLLLVFGSETHAFRSLLCCSTRAFVRVMHTDILPSAQYSHGLVAMGLHPGVR